MHLNYIKIINLNKPGAEHLMIKILIIYKSMMNKEKCRMF